MSEFVQVLRGLARTADMELTEVQLEQFARYYELLIEWNDRVNLTAITELREVAIKHFVDSLSVARFVDDYSNRQPLRATTGVSLIDVGTGAGFPGIPLKIVRPQIKLTLLDSLNKRLKFLQAVVAELGLVDVELVHGRAEEAGCNQKYRDGFDIATARAVARLNVLAELCLPFVKPGGIFIAQKGAAAADEISESVRALQVLGGKISCVSNVKLPELEDARTIIVVSKLVRTPKGFPRNPGTPNRQPL